ncbi:MAG TPA: DUF222 domain-containing protein [Ilumatobacteraceae bacterium]|nr:DUF222 domain-containing protein [Ilumatobacteraceae bacterium]
MSKGIGNLAGVIDSLLDVDPFELTDDELHELVTAVQRQRHRLAAVAARAVSAWDQRMVWADNGARSAATRLANETSASTSSAGTEVRRARQLRSMPATAAALASGELSPDHVDLLARASRPWRNASFADHEETLVEQCTVLRFFDARKMIDYWCTRADAEAAEDQAERQRNAAHLDVASTLDGTVVVNGLLDPIGGSIVSDELTRLERELYLADQRDGITRTSSQRRAAALAVMATRSATTPADGRRPKPLFTALVGDATLSQLCELANGTVITPGQLVRWIDDADLESVLFDGPSTVISVSHRRSFTGALRRAVEVRDRGCQHDSGCDVPADQCDVDHIVPYAADGPTSQFNGKLECPPHNRDSDRHDHGGTPRPSRPVDRLDEIRCRLRWKFLREEPDEEPDDVVEVVEVGAADGEPDAQSFRSHPLAAQLQITSWAAPTA